MKKYFSFQKKKMTDTPKQIPFSRLVAATAADFLKEDSIWKYNRSSKDESTEVKEEMTQYWNQCQDPVKSAYVLALCMKDFSTLERWFAKGFKVPTDVYVGAVDNVEFLCKNDREYALYEWGHSAYDDSPERAAVLLKYLTPEQVYGIMIQKSGLKYNLASVQTGWYDRLYQFVVKNKCLPTQAVFDAACEEKAWWLVEAILTTENEKFAPFKAPVPTKHTWCIADREPALLCILRRNDCDEIEE